MTMTKRLLVLNGLACLMIPINHAASYGLQALFLWTDRYMNVQVPNYDQLGSLTYYVLIFSRNVEHFAIPAFLFVSGFFIAFLARGNDYRVSWDMVLPRVKVLIPPFVIWTVFRFVLLLGPPSTIQEILQPYWFILFLIQCYLLSPIIVPLAKKNWVVAFAISAVLQLSVYGARYIFALGIDFPALRTFFAWTPMWFFPFQIMNFTLGVILGVHLNTVLPWLKQHRKLLLTVVVSSLLLSFVEYEWVDRLNPDEWLGAQFTGLFSLIYASTFSLCYLGFENFKIPLSDFFAWLGPKSLGVYMGNIPAIYVMARFLYWFLPWVLGVQILYQLFLIAAGLGIPLLLMEVARRTRLRVAYRYVFG